MLFFAALAHADPIGPCGFDRATLAFAGAPAEQARCLLRPVLPGGELGPPLDALPVPLDGRVGQPVDLTVEALRAYLAEVGVTEAELGGSLDEPVSRTEGDLPALYFVIHDTSTPNYGAEPFPADIDEPTWRFNRLSPWTRGTPVAHLVINRAGASVSPVDLSRGWRATKLESKVIGTAARGRFLHVEDVQPRRSAEDGAAGNDRIAPEPGFTVEQLRRLGLVYVAASVRAGVWLVPAFHAAIDGGIEGAHDDPQHFPLEQWAELLRAQLEDLRGI